MRLTPILSEALSGTRDILPKIESESTDASLTTATEQPEPSDFEFPPALERGRSTFVGNGTSITTPPDYLLLNDSRNLKGSNKNMAGHRDTMAWWGNEKNGTSDAANEQGVTAQLIRSQDRIGDGIVGAGAVEPQNHITTISIHDEHRNHTFINPIESTFGIYQDSEETVDEALTHALGSHEASTSPDDAIAWMVPDSGAYCSEDNWWGDDRSDGDASAVEEFGNVEYSFSDVDLSDVETIDEDSIEVDYPSDEEDSTGLTTDGESLSDVDDSMEASNPEDPHARFSARRPSGRELTVVAPLDSQSSRILEEPPFLVRNELLSQQLRTRNPWRTLQRYYPCQKETTVAGPCFPIHRLPIELLRTVAKYLPAESAASFTLPSKRAYMAFGTQYLKFTDKSSLWNFRLLIESERQASFACCVCLKLHRPSISQRIGVSKCAKLWSKREDTRLPASVTSGLVKMIGRKHLEDPRVCQEYLSWAAESTKKTTRHIKVAQHVTPRMVGGNLLIKTETYVHPFRNGELTHRSLYELFRLLEPSWHINDKLYDICGHRSWEQELSIAGKRKGFLDDPLATK